MGFYLMRQISASIFNVPLLGRAAHRNHRRFGM
jgi:hypothetical protein